MSGVEVSVPAPAGDPPTRVIVVEDEDDVGRAIARRLSSEGLSVDTATDPRPVVGRFEDGADDWDVVLLDIGLPVISGIEVLHRVRESGSLASVIMLTGDNSANTAAECMRAGAFHYLTKPFRSFELSTVVASAARYTALRRQLAGAREILDAGGERRMIGTSAAMRRVRASLDRLADQSVSILIQGESGTGKELVARALHDRSGRRTKPFVALNCGAIPDTLIDSELFGHQRGAFTGATSDRAGVFVEADGGTLFLDEIGDMPLSVQARLLRVLQEGEVRPVGASGVRSVDVRVIAASHVDLAAAVATHRFRQDLFYRLNVVVLDIPPLRERLDDLPLLAAHFLRKHGGAHPPALSPPALEAMADYPWPGNVRELENAIMHAVALHHGDTIGTESLPHQIGMHARRGSREIAELEVDLDQLPLTDAKRQASASFERRYLVRVLERARGSISEAARLAGVDRANFRRLLHRHAIDVAIFKT